MSESDTAVAIAGLALRAPGAASTADFWSAVVDGRVVLPAAQQDGCATDRPLAGQIERFAEFDADLFNVLPAHAAAMDPQHRVLTELVWEALEDAGLDTRRSTERVGVFAGCGPDTYLHSHVLADEKTVRSLGREQIALGNARDYLTTAVSYRLGLTGPSITVQTACSTGLVAVHQAVRSLLTYECDVAIAGGVSVHPEEDPSYEYVEGGITSPDGRCRAFTEGSLGTVPSSGGAVVVLRRAADVAATGSPVRATILGSAVNNDGADRMSLVAPSPRGQAEALREALDMAGLDPSDIGFIETHGTGTVLGDQVELAALAEVYGTGAPLALGAVKANIGHCDTAAGAIGLVKAVLALEEGVLPPTPAQPGDGPDAPLGSPGFFLPRTAREWPEDLPRRAAVSSFGLGGTNAHVVLGAPHGVERDAQAGAEDPATAREGRGPRVAVLSAATPEALRERAADLADWLDGAGAEAADGDLFGTLWHGRRPLAERWALALPHDSARQDLREALDGLARGGGGRTSATTPRIAVVLPGQGGELHGLGGELASADPLFGTDLASLHNAVLNAGGPDLRSAATWAADDPRLLDTAMAQPLLFALGLAGLRALKRAGAEPAVVLGHSVGELTAAAYAEVWSDADAAAAVVRRGRLMADAPEGAMLAVQATQDRVHELARGLDVDVCVRNAPDNTVMGGTPEAVDALTARCVEQGVTTRRLRTTRAFHSRLMDEAATDFARFVGTLTPRPPTVRIMSNLTGEPLTAEEAVDPAYWGRQLRGTVEFEAALHSLLASAPEAVVALHGARAMSSLARAAARRQGVPALFVDALPKGGRGEVLDWHDLLAGLWTAGCPVEPLAAPPRRRVRLPRYPFSRTRHWIAAAPAVPAPRTASSTCGTAESAPVDGGAGDEGGTHGDIDALVARSWQEAFGGEPLKPEDNFFDLGGTSLQAARLITVVNDLLLVEAHLQDLYEHSSLGAFTTRVAGLAAERDDAELLRMLDEIEAQNGGTL
ncbi:beta-ketoacyl synthase N-terminal-like domain-containing protein [Streptomyces lavendofoliae]|uniref:beta-ketoacyl synthase N-terminal-like domain-containing protein n=1 Tax=Streptomyces lavendofoliae TaxID=67314 RepID=UPI003D8C2E02